MASDTKNVKKKNNTAKTYNNNKNGTNKKGTGNKNNRNNNKNKQVTQNKNKTNTNKKNNSNKIKKEGTIKNTKNAPQKKKVQTKVSQEVKTKKSKALVNEDLDRRDTIDVDLEKTIVISTSEVKKNLDNKKSKNALPKTIFGASMPIGNSAEEKNTRINYYIKEAIVFAILVPFADLLLMLSWDSYTYFNMTSSEPINYAITFVIDFTLGFLVTFIVDYIYGEDKIKRWHK